MKTRISFSILIAIGLMPFWACENNSMADKAADAADKAATAMTETAEKVGNKLTGGPITPQDSISADTAMVWAGRWEKALGNGTITKIQGFVLPVVDLQQIVGESGVDSARFYMGINGTGEYKLMAVGVNSSGDDMVNTSPNTPLQRIYDLSSPCPPACGSTIGQ